MKLGKQLVAFALVALLLVGAGAARAAVMTVSGVAPAVDGADIAQLVGATDIGGDEGHLWSDRPNQGQTFTTLASNQGYTLTAVTLRNLTNNNSTGTWTVRIGSIYSVSFYPLRTETATGVSIAPNNFATWTLASPVSLAPNTLYAFDGTTSASGFITANNPDVNSYTGGAAYSSGDNQIPTNPLTFRAADRVFHTDMIQGMSAPLSSGRISINFAGGSSGNFGPHNVTGTAGVVPLANWNNLVGAAWNNPDVFAAPLKDSSGLTTTARATIDLGNTWGTGGPTATDNDRLMFSYLDSAQGQLIEVRGLDPRFTDWGYKVIVYYDTDGGGEFGIRIDDSLGNSRTKWAYERLGVNWPNAPGFIESLALTQAAAQTALANNLTSNYLVLDGFFGANFSFTLTNGSGFPNGRARINGLEILSNIPEPTTLSLAALGLLGLARRRRTRQG